MRSFTDILLESKKTYSFKIGLAGELPEGTADRLETALSKYKVVKMGSGKKTPIQERPLDFPDLQNTEVTYYEVEVEYPTTTRILHEYLSQICHMPRTNIIVRNPNEPIEAYKQTDPAEAQKNPKALLTQHELGGTSVQQQAGSNRVMDLLKELEKARKEREHCPTDDTPMGDSKKMDDKQNTKSVLDGTLAPKTRGK